MKRLHQNVQILRGTVDSSFNSSSSGLVHLKVFSFRRLSGEQPHVKPFDKGQALYATVPLYKSQR
jgi:hypothetical protein